MRDKQMCSLETSWKASRLGKQHINPCTYFLYFEISSDRASFIFNIQFSCNLTIFSAKGRLIYFQSKCRKVLVIQYIIFIISSYKFCVQDD